MPWICLSAVVIVVFHDHTHYYYFFFIHVGSTEILSSVILRGTVIILVLAASNLGYLLWLNQILARHKKMGLDARNPVFGGLRTTKAQTSLLQTKF